MLATLFFWLAQSDTIKIILQVSVTGVKFNQNRFIDALSHKCSIPPQRMRLLQVDSYTHAHTHAHARTHTHTHRWIRRTTILPCTCVC